MQVFRRAGAIENSLTRYKQQAEIQAVAAFMAQQFNKTVVNKAVARAAGLSGVPEVKYTMVSARLGAQAPRCELHSCAGGASA